MSKASAGPLLIFLYGPPAVGKLTVARAIAQRREFRLLHNHITFDPVAEVLPIGTPTFWATLDIVRVELVTAAAREGIDLVYTFVFAPGDERHVEDVASAYESVGGSVIFVRLLAPPEVLRRRVAEGSRVSHAKITDVATLDQVLREHDVYAPIPARESLSVDVAAVSADDAAEQVIGHIDGVMERE